MKNSQIRRKLEIEDLDWWKQLAEGQDRGYYFIAEEVMYLRMPRYSHAASMVAMPFHVLRKSGYRFL
ncbi:predicted protein [Sclerotinia sclerotiorum 1980 UF-70]|uniref:Uncharacterized protein n=1 Tax=Sclerotinia sclerotiorum (strain ATCC 18683 / 1980 / Ss-1) TaxID=665079 RepID=A7EY28_SCLS1|nr:predicted protein [Sclerotinia sclerotiorum 1980 UF-70]EDN94370.1 predicted protein [Sclerotinia sclerotiorum 1980 UF-70]